jgi:Skp family chaperone for outer membrane proteins
MGIVRSGQDWTGRSNGLKEEEKTVNRTIWCAAVLATLATFGLAEKARAQTRVAVVNIGAVLTKYEKAKTIKAEMEQTLKPFKEEAEKIKKNLIAYGEASQKTTDAKLREQYDQAQRVLKRQLEDLDLEARKKLSTRQEQNLIQLYTEVTKHIEAVANANGIHLVLGFGEPPDANLLTYMNINRKLSAMDMGSTVPLFYHQSLDISETVISSLNRAFTGGTAVTPVSNQK